MYSVARLKFHCCLFQEFDDYRDADDAVYELNGKELLGERWVLLILFLAYDYRCFVLN